MVVEPVWKKKIRIRKLIKLSQACSFGASTMKLPTKSGLIRFRRCKQPPIDPRNFHTPE